MATEKRPQYTFTIDESMKKRMLNLPVEIHRSFADPMRAHLEKLVSKAERKADKNGKE